MQAPLSSLNRIPGHKKSNTCPQNTLKSTPFYKTRSILHHRSTFNSSCSIYNFELIKKINLIQSPKSRNKYPRVIENFPKPLDQYIIPLPNRISLSWRENEVIIQPTSNGSRRRISSSSFYPSRLVERETKNSIWYFCLFFYVFIGSAARKV